MEQKSLKWVQGPVFIRWWIFKKNGLWILLTFPWLSYYSLEFISDLNEKYDIYRNGWKDIFKGIYGHGIK